MPDNDHNAFCEHMDEADADNFAREHDLMLADDLADELYFDAYDDCAYDEEVFDFAD